MKLKFSLPILLIITTCFPILSQDLGSTVLSDIITASPTTEGKKQVPKAVPTGLAGALDFIGAETVTPDKTGSSAPPLDYVTAVSDDADPYSALTALFSQPKSAGSGIDILDMISGAYNDSGYYISGVFDSMDFNNYKTSPTAIAPMSGMALYNPEWGRITSGFGYRPNFKRMHKGIDIAMNVGDTVRAALPGTIENVAYEAKGYGHYIIMRHDNGMETRYAHLSGPLVSIGQQVMAGEPIALSGNTGNSTGPHLHFETRYNGQPVDPESVFSIGGSQYGSYNNTADIAATSTEPIATGFNGSKKSLLGKSTYVVREGDTLSKIAKRANTTVLRLCQLNFMMESQTLMPGTMLKLK